MSEVTPFLQVIDDGEPQAAENLRPLAHHE